jgi:hypothetical protein
MKASTHWIVFAGVLWLCRCDSAVSFSHADNCAAAQLRGSRRFQTTSVKSAVWFRKSHTATRYMNNKVKESVTKSRTNRLDFVATQLLSSMVTSVILLLTLTTAPQPTHAAAVAAQTTLGMRCSQQVQQSSFLASTTTLLSDTSLSQSVRWSVVRSAQLADALDLKWERLGDSLRDQQKCDPITNRRMFDNGVRRDGSHVGNPVLGALCAPEPLRPLDLNLARMVMDAAQQVAAGQHNDKLAILQAKEQQVQELVRPSFARVVADSLAIANDDKDSVVARQAYNRDLYARMRAYGEVLSSTSTTTGSTSTSLNGQEFAARDFERNWGRQLLAMLAPKANRNDFKSPFPKPDAPAPLYDETALLDALGAVSVALDELQKGGFIGHWEISIPQDDDWNVVTVAVDDDISIGGQILGRERKQLLSGSVVTALVRSAMEDQAKILYKLDAFFIDPTTTRQELYNPTQLLLSLSDLGQ